VIPNPVDQFGSSFRIAGESRESGIYHQKRTCLLPDRHMRRLRIYSQLISAPPASTLFFNGTCSISGTGASADPEDGIMLLQPHQSDRLRKLQGDVQRAQKVTRALMADVLAVVGERYSVSPSLGSARQIRTLLEAEAWTDAALALLDLELPQWKLRRVAYDDGEWRCCLGKQWPLPEWLDDTVDVGHRVLPLAILDAMIEARAVAQTFAAAAPRSVPPVRLLSDAAHVCCDNFARSP
jgi:hypothetical protein